MNTLNIQPSGVSAHAWIMICVLSIIWGGSFLFGKILVAYWPPFTIVFARVFLAAIVLWGYVFLTRGAVSLSYNLFGTLIILGIVNNAIPFSLIVTGQKEVGAGLASIVNAMTPIWTLIIANYATRDEKFSLNKIGGILAGFLGVGILIGVDVGTGFHEAAWAQFAILCATISYGVAAVYAKRFKAHDPTLIAAGQLLGASLVMFPLMMLFDDPFSLPPPTWTVISSVIGFAVLCTAVAYVLFFKIVAKVGATNVSLVTFLAPVSAILWGMMILEERLTLSNIIGMLCILAGLIMIDGRIFTRQR